MLQMCTAHSSRIITPHIYLYCASMELEELKPPRHS